MGDTRVQPKVELIPWDSGSQEHLDRMFQQRVMCGWRSEQVDEWRRETEEGVKCMYWAVLTDDTENKEELEKRHTERNPKEAAQLRDTATTLWGTTRAATGRAFGPVGHVALWRRPETDARVGLGPEGHCWIAALFVSWALQGTGVGRAVMAAAEAAAARPPLGCHSAVLDTMPADFQMDPRVVANVYTRAGVPAPAVSNQEWYTRQGYEVFHKGDVYKWDDGSGEIVNVPLLFFKKKLR